MFGFGTVTPQKSELEVKVSRSAPDPRPRRVQDGNAQDDEEERVRHRGRVDRRGERSDSLCKNAEMGQNLDRQGDSISRSTHGQA